MSFLRKQESRYLVPPKSPSLGLGFALAGLSRRGRGGLLHSAKDLPKFLRPQVSLQAGQKAGAEIVKMALSK